MIDFALTESQLMLQDSVRRLMADHAPEDYLRRLDEAVEYPYALYERWVDSGLIALPFPEEHGGQGGSLLDFVVVAEEIGRSGYDLVGVYGTPIFNALNITEHGSVDQVRRFIPPFLSGDLRFSIAMTEPGAGSDAGAMRTNAVRDGDRYVLNGEKMFASGADVDRTTICLYAKTDPEVRHQEGVSCFLVPNDTPGVHIRRVPTLGRHMFPTTQIVLEDAKVPVESRLGEENEGWKVLLSGLGLERVVTSAAYVGNAQTVVDEALAYARQREQFGRPIGDFQVIAHMLADMQTEVDAARLLAYRAAWSTERGDDSQQAISMAKLFGSEAFSRIAAKGLQILGGYGYSMEMPMQRHLRAAVGSTITAGTSEMQRQTIARLMGLRPR